MRFSENKKGFFEGKGFYIVLALCLVAIGAAAWSAASAFSNIKDNEQVASKQTPSLTVKAEKDDVEKQSSSNTVSEETSSNQSVIEESIEEHPETPKPEDPTPVAKYFVLPVSGEIMKGFSADKLQYSITYNDRRLHKAIDIAAEEGAPVKASGEGKVTDLSTDSLLGVVVTIDHGNGIIGYYCGLGDAVKVKTGDTVSGGMVIGSVGQIPCESLDPTHLHLEFTKDGQYVSPLKIMGLEE